MYVSLTNRTSEKIYEQIEIDSKFIEIDILANETLYNIECKTIQLPDESKLEVVEQSGWYEEEANQKYFKDTDTKEINDVIKYRISIGNNPKKIAIFPSVMHRKKGPNNTQYYYNSYYSMFKHISPDEVGFIELLDYDGIFGKYSAMNSENELRYKLFIQELISKYNLDYSDIIYIGGSKAGSSALYLSSLHGKCTVVSIMAQTKYDNYFIDQRGRHSLYYLGERNPIDFTKYIGDDIKYYMYFGTKDFTSNYYYYNELMLTKDFKNIDVHLINRGHDVQVFYKYDFTYQLDKLINKYQEKKLNDIVIDTVVQEYKVKVQVSLNRKFENRTSFKLLISLKGKNFYYHLDYNKLNDVCTLAECGQFNYIDFGELLGEDETIQSAKIQFIAIDVETKEIYKSPLQSINLNYRLTTNFKNIIKPKLEVLVYKQIKHLFVFEAQMRPCIEQNIKSCQLIVNTKNGNKFAFPMHAHKRVYVTRFILNGRTPLHLLEEATELEILVVDSWDRLYTFNVPETEKNKMVN